MKCLLWKDSTSTLFAHVIPPRGTSYAKTSARFKPFGRDGNFTTVKRKWTITRFSLM